MLLDTVFMIRNGLIGTDFNYKLILSLVALLICAIDWRLNKRYDYFWVYLIGTIIWTAVELLLQVYGIRDIHQGSIFGVEMPLFVTVLLQGTFEGATLTILALWIGDGLMNENKKVRYSFVGILIGLFSFIIIQTVIQAVPIKDVGGDVASRRDMLFLPGVIILVGFAVLDAVWFCKRKDSIARKRAFSIFLFICILGGVWTIAEVIANTRWIEVGTLSNLSRAPLLIEFGALLYDVVIEAGTAYALFYILPYELKLIKNEK